jgi:hypothetical protein
MADRLAAWLRIGGLVRRNGPLAAPVHRHGAPASWFTGESRRPVAREKGVDPMWLTGSSEVSANSAFDTAGDPARRPDNRLSQQVIFRNGIYPLKMARGFRFRS